MNSGDRIVKLRERKGWNQREIAQRIGINVSVMNRIESGDRPIKDHELASLAKSLETTTDYILGLSENPKTTAEEEFQAFANDPEMGRWYRELPESDEEDLRKLREMWEIIRRDPKRK
ncbi:helix-turn-helix domain-containing protein [Sporosarcina sp. A2]|uniref:helix-turn-helix domain-containing protein n=1 Tax=Sporosarcina sp. A2 TaxID=3393449 RepID=UPI003D791DE7